MTDAIIHPTAPEYNHDYRPGWMNLECQRARASLAELRQAAADAWKAYDGEMDRQLVRGAWDHEILEPLLHAWEDAQAAYDFWAMLHSRGVDITADGGDLERVIFQILEQLDALE